VAANAPIEDKISNALDNLRGAVRFIEEKRGRGAFAVYRNASADRVRVHRATRLIGSLAYTDDLMSVKDRVFGEFDRNFNFVKNPDYYELPDKTEPFDSCALTENNNDALVLFSYPAMTYPEIGENIKYVIFNTYHSGTLNTVSDAALRFFSDAKERGIPVFATGAEKGLCYSSSAEFHRLGIIPLFGLSPVAAYVKLWLAHSCGKDLTKTVNSSLSGDVFPQIDKTRP
jgi:L-asparaginase